jgi:acyl transferase domain-containing protein/acyl-CoA synthetase (AMP-forming)/AMP-acid ligase II/SAM-dependent methyltransferase/acyl carrier protein
MSGWNRHSNLVELLRLRAGQGECRGFSYEAESRDKLHSLTFAELDVRARALAARLQEDKFAGKTVLLCYPAGLDFLVGLFACLYAGAIAVPTNVSRARRAGCRFAAVAADAGASLALTCAAWCQDLAGLSKEMPELRHLRWLDSSKLNLDDAAGWRHPELSPTRPAILQYTSGSTGNPKGVVLTHACLLHNLERMFEVLRLYDGVTAVSWLPAFHDMGLIGNLLQAVFSHGQMHMMAPVSFLREPLRWLEAIGEYGAYVSGAPNFAFDLCVQRAEKAEPEELARLDLSTWKMGYIGAEPISPATLERFTKTFAANGFEVETFFPCYGLAEATLMVSGGPGRLAPRGRLLLASALEVHRAVPANNGAPTRQVIGCGQPLADMEVAIVDPATCLPCSPGEIGEIWVAGPSVAQGYWNRPEESAHTFAAVRADIPERRYLRTGDLGFLDAGELFVTGRIKDLIIIRGRNLYPQDVEDTVRQEVAGCEGPAAAFAVPGSDTEKLVLVQEVARSRAPENADNLFRQIRQTIVEHFEVEIQSLVLIRAGSLPRSSSGKIRRRECQRRFLAGELEAVAKFSRETSLSASATSTNGTPIRKQGDVEAWLIDRLARHLHVPVEEIDVRQPFAAYGLDSTAMVAVAAELEKWLGRKLSPTLLYDAPTIPVLAHLLSKDEGHGTRNEDRESRMEDRKNPSPILDPRFSILSSAIAIVGIGCRFPGGESPEAFWKLLREGRHAIRNLPPSRRQRRAKNAAANLAGFLDQVQCSDLSFFGISPREGAFIDPQHRLLLEVAWESLEYGGISPHALAGSNAGVFMGIATGDYSNMLLGTRLPADTYSSTGNARAMAANRLSYHLDLRGPSLTIDTACSSSLVAVHYACQSLRAGDCELALVGGVNLILTPELSDALAQAQFLSPSGRCHSFDAEADGYVRGEGCGIVVLKPLANAIRDRDTILAVIEGSAVNQDGKSNGITAPNGPSQAEVIKRAMKQANRAPRDISFFETHGTGTSLGDPIEFDALATVLGEGKGPCFLGAVKANVGHLEAAAGIASLIKVVLQLQHGEITPLAHLEEINPRIHLKGSRFSLPTKAEPWSGQPRVAGISSFGFGGTNAHILVSDAATAIANCKLQIADSISSKSPICNLHSTISGKVHLLPLSARNPQALKELAARYRDMLNEPARVLGDICHSAAIGRAHWEHRLCIQAASVAELRESLDRFHSGTPDGRTQVGSNLFQRAPQVAWIFTGNGASLEGGAGMLADACPVFRENLERCEKILKKHRAFANLSLLKLLSQESEAKTNGVDYHLEDTNLAQPLLFALEVSLAQMWRALGMEPAALLGHSLGEYAAACVAGVFSIEEGLELVLARGQAMHEVCPPGAMLACFASVEEVARVLELPMADGNQQSAITLAVINGLGQVVLSGTPAAIQQAADTLQRQKITSRLLRVPRAFHSPWIEAALPGLEKAAAAIPHQNPRWPLVSNVTGTFHTGPMGPEYWLKHARQPVQFQAGLDSLLGMGITHFLEIGPEGMLCRLGKAYPPAAAACWLPSLQAGEEDWNVVLGSLARLYVQGATIHWSELDRGSNPRRVLLPTYPFQRQRFWIDEPQEPMVGAESDSGTSSEISSSLAATAWMPRSHWSQNLPRRDLTQAVDVQRLVEGLGGAVVQLQAKHKLELFSDLRQDFDRLTTRYLVETFGRLGWTTEAGIRVHAETLGQTLGILPRYQRLLSRLLTLGMEDGLLIRDGKGYVVTCWPSFEPASELQQQLHARFPAFDAELTLAHRCATNMADVMKGMRDPLDVLFSEEAVRVTERLYEKSPVASFYNELLAEVIGSLVASLPAERPVRILELGAGTGGTTAHVAPRLPPDRAEFVFTDVSSAFLARAQEKFAAFPSFQYRLLDLDKDLKGQGFAGGQFDLIVAANVLHATRDIRRSLQQAHRLLAPGGLLFLLESTERHRLLDIIFGLTEGWWGFTDTELRPDHPLLTPQRWLQVLGEEGFEPLLVPGVAQDQSVLIGTKRVSNALECGVCCRFGSSPSSPAANAAFQNLAAYFPEEEATFIVDPCAKAGTLFDDREVRNQNKRQVIHLGALNAETPPGLHNILNLARDVAQHGASLTVVTKGGLTTLKDFRSLGDFGSLGLRWVDLDPEYTLETQMAVLMEALRHADPETVAVYRGDQRYVPRLKPEVSEQGFDSSQIVALSLPDSEGRVLIQPGPDHPFFSDCKRKGKVTPESASLIRQSLLKLPPGERGKVLQEFLRREFASITGHTLDDADLDKPLQSFGLDSLMAIQLRNRVEAELKISLSLVDFLKGLSLSQIVANANQEMEEQAGGKTSNHLKASDVSDGSLGALNADHVEDLSERELDRFLHSLLTQGADNVTSHDRKEVLGIPAP